MARREPPGWADEPALPGPYQRQPRLGPSALAPQFTNESSMNVFEFVRVRQRIGRNTQLSEQFGRDPID